MENNSVLIKPNNLDDIFKEFPISFRESIKDIIKQEGYVKYNVEKNILPQAGNFLSCLYEIDITGETVDCHKVTPLFVKKSVTFDKITLSDVCLLYNRELFVYKELTSLFSRLQCEADIPVEKMLIFLKSYNSDNECVIMENLSKKGFKSCDATKVITIKFAELSIIELAKFHAMSYVVKKREPKYFDNNIKVIKQSFNLNSDWNGFIHNVCAAAAQVVSGEAKEKIKNYAPRMLHLYKKYMQEVIPTNGCLCHGDYKVLNILAKEVDGEITEVRPIDYQLIYYGNPVDDFLFFIFTGTDREFRKKYLSYLKNLYFKTFTEFLGHFKIDVNSTYPQEEFDKDYKERFELGLGMGLFVTVFTFARPNEDFDVSRLTLSELPIVPDEKFGKRVRGIIEDYIDWGCL